MKKIILSTIILLAAVAVKAQVKVGIQATGGNSWASYPAFTGSTVKDKGIASFGGGFIVDLPVGRSTSITTGLSYIRKGMKLNIVTEEVGMKSTLDGTARLNYAELPVQLTWSVEKGNRRISFSAGPSLGYGFSGRAIAKTRITQDGQVILEGTEKTDPFKKTPDNEDNLRRWELSGLVSAGVEFRSGIYLKANFLRGFTDIQRGTDYYRNRTGFITIGYFFK